jgi:hypothetical protein
MNRDKKDIMVYCRNRGLISWHRVLLKGIRAPNIRSVEII